MGFTDTTVKRAFQKANGKCENCNKRLSYRDRGDTWHAHHKHSQRSGGSDY